MSLSHHRGMRWTRVAWFALLFLLVSCSKPDPTLILGNWRAESFTIDSLKLPIAPSFEVTRNEMILKSPDGVPFQKLPLAAIRAEDTTIEIEFRDGFGVALVFIVDSRDRIRFKVPLMPFDIAYRRN